VDTSFTVIIVIERNEKYDDSTLLGRDGHGSGRYRFYRGKTVAVAVVVAVMVAAKSTR
jgi:hypothetical protein